VLLADSAAWARESGWEATSGGTLGGALLLVLAAVGTAPALAAGFLRGFGEVSVVAMELLAPSSLEPSRLGGADGLSLAAIIA
jgi:hypothetical protein